MRVLLVLFSAGLLLYGCRTEKREETLKEKMFENVRDAIDAVVDNLSEGDEWFNKGMQAPDPLVRRKFLNIALDYYCTARQVLLERIRLARDPYVKNAHKKLLWAVEGCIEKAVSEMPLLD